MSDSLRNFYQRVYPAMSHPPADPAVTSAAARIAGWPVVTPAQSAILEIGCGSGHHLLSLASRWPKSLCTGVDISEASIRSARALATQAGIRNVLFHAASLLDFEPSDGPFDYIIAHGFFSWVPDEVKERLFDFCKRHLSHQGLAVISFNVAAGWNFRLPVIQKARAIMQAGDVDEMTALHVLRTVTTEALEFEIIDDMLAKGLEILSFDDFAPVNDPWSLDRFVHEAQDRGLRWLGESELAENRYQITDAAPISHFPSDWLASQQAADELTRRTFRAPMLGRADVTIQPIDGKEVLDYFVRKRPSTGKGDAEILHALNAYAGSAIRMTELAEKMNGMTLQEFAKRVLRGAMEGWLELRSEAVEIPPQIPERPCLNAWRMTCASHGLPIVDAWLKSCAFPPQHYKLLASMDGSRSLLQLEEVSRIGCPELDFKPWIAHLNGRGFFS